MSPQPPSESEFQALVARGEQRRAAEWLVLRYADEVMGLCLAMVRNRTTAEDLVQDVFGRAFLGLKGFRGDASARTWLLTIARNRCFDYLRARKREPWGAPGSGTALEPDSVPEEVPLPSELLARRVDVEAALDELPEADRALIVLRFRNGLEYAELAIAFGLKQGAVRMRVSRSLNRMRKVLEARGVEQAAQALPAPRAAAPRAAAPRRAPTPPQRQPAPADEFEEFLEEPTGAAAAEPGFGSTPAASGEFDEFAAPEEFGADEEDGAALYDLDAQVAPEREAEPEFENEPTPPMPMQFMPPPSPIFIQPPAPPAPPVEHPLTAFFAATRDALSSDLRNRLLDGARQV